MSCPASADLANGCTRLPINRLMALLIGEARESKVGSLSSATATGHFKKSMMPQYLIKQNEKIQIRSERLVARFIVYNSMVLVAQLLL